MEQTIQLNEHNKQEYPPHAHERDILFCFIDKRT